MANETKFNLETGKEIRLIIKNDENVAVEVDGKHTINDTRYNKTDGIIFEAGNEKRCLKIKVPYAAKDGVNAVYNELHRIKKAAYVETKTEKVDKLHRKLYNRVIGTMTTGVCKAV